MLKKISSKAEAVLWKIAPLLAVIITLFIVTVIAFLVEVGYVHIYSTKAENPASLYNNGDIVNFEYQVIASDKHNLIWVKHLGDNSVYIAEISCNNFFELNFWSKTFLSNEQMKELTEIKIVKRIEKSDYEGGNSCEIVN